MTIAVDMGRKATKTNKHVSSFAIILTRKRELRALLYLSPWCLVTVALPYDAMGWSDVCGIS